MSRGPHHGTGESVIVGAGPPGTLERLDVAEDGAAVVVVVPFVGLIVTVTPGTVTVEVTVEVRGANVVVLVDVTAGFCTTVVRCTSELTVAPGAVLVDVTVDVTICAGRTPLEPPPYPKPNSRNASTSSNAPNANPISTKGIPKRASASPLALYRP